MAAQSVSNTDWGRAIHHPAGENQTTGLLIDFEDRKSVGIAARCDEKASIGVEVEVAWPGTADGFVFHKDKFAGHLIDREDGDIVGSTVGGIDELAIRVNSDFRGLTGNFELFKGNILNGLNGLE